MTPVILGAARRALVMVGHSVVVLALSACAVGGVAQPGTSPSQALLERGGRLYQANCQSCHGGATGGSLRDIPPPHNANGHTWHHADQQIVDIILNGFAFSIEGPQMPAFKDKLTEEDARAVLAYVKTWWTKEQREWQAKVTAQWGK